MSTAKTPECWLENGPGSCRIQRNSIGSISPMIIEKSSNGGSPRSSTGELLLRHRHLVPVRKDDLASPGKTIFGMPNDPLDPAEHIPPILLRVIDRVYRFTVGRMNRVRAHLLSVDSDSVRLHRCCWRPSSVKGIYHPWRYQREGQKVRDGRHTPNRQRNEWIFMRVDAFLG